MKRIAFATSFVIAILALMVCFATAASAGSCACSPIATYAVPVQPVAVVPMVRARVRLARRRPFLGGYAVRPRWRTVILAKEMKPAIDQGGP